MDPTAALLAGLTVGLMIAMQVGAVSLLLVEAAVVGGPRAGVAAGLGVATADLAFAVIAVATGGAAGAALAGHQAEIRLVAALALAAVAIAGLLGPIRSNEPAHGAEPQQEARDAPAPAHYGRFLAITAVNPLTIASFAALAAALSLDGGASATAFVAGVGLASTAWHVALALAAGHAGRWLTQRVRRGLAIGGRLGVLAIAARLALGA
jgi:threonine/homoserine/homoserine lactone efflux protein